MSELEGSSEPFCYLTTIGRRSGQSHEIEIWFAAREDTLYLLSGGGGGSDWVKNLIATPDVRVRIRAHTYEGRARLVEDSNEESWVRSAVLAKYQPGYSGDLTDWGRKALPVAIDLAR